MTSQAAGEAADVFEARLTNARFLGDVTCVKAGKCFQLSGLRAPSGLFRWRLILQWTLAAVALLGLALRVSYSLQLLGLSVVFSLFSYLAMWWTAKREVVTVDPRTASEPQIGWVWRPQDLLMLNSVIAWLALSNASARTVSFRFAPEARKSVLVILHAKSSRAVGHLLVAFDSAMQEGAGATVPSNNRFQTDGAPRAVD